MKSHLSAGAGADADGGGGHSGVVSGTGSSDTDGVSDWVVTAVGKEVVAEVITVSLELSPILIRCPSLSLVLHHP